MALESDSRGFLVGNPIDIGRMPNDISRIRDDVSAIRRAIAERGRSFSGSERTNFATPERGANGRFVSKSTPAIATPSGSRKLDPVQAAIAEGARNAVAERIRRVSNSSGSVLPGRDSAGRFAAGGINSGSANSAIASIGDRLARLTGAASGIEDADPAVKAAREIAEPMQRTFEFFRGDKQTSWLKKIFSKLSIFHKEESVYNRASAKTLKNIEGKTGIPGEDGSFSGGAMGSILGRAIPWALGGLAAAGTGIATTIGGALTAAIAAIFSPIGVAVAAAGMAAWGTFTEDGRKFFADLGGKMAEGWGKFTDFLVESSPKTMEFLKKAGEKASAAVDSVKDTAGKATSFVIEQAKDASNYLVESSPKTMAAIDKVVTMAKGAGNWVLGETSKLFESGKGGAGTISGGIGDLGGASYGTYQLASKTGTLQQFLRNSKYGDKFAGLKPGSPEFNAKWKDVAKNDPQFSAAQHDFIKATHFDPAMRMLNKNGIDLSEKGAAVQDSIWSTSVQFGAGGGSNLIKKALAGKNISALSDAEIVSAIQDYKAANNDKLFAKSSAKVRSGTLSRAFAEKEQLLNLATRSASAPPISQSYKSPSMAPLAEAPKVVEPLNSPVSPEFTVNIPSQDVGQRLSDRTTAYIASGGIHK